MSFQQLNLIEPLLRAIAGEGYSQPTPIQEKAVPHVLAGRDVLGVAQTGTGKTAAFALPILQRLLATQPRAAHGQGAPRRGIRVLVVAPTRELAAQIGESFSTYGRHTRITNTVIFGGVGQDAQVRTLRNGVDVLVATPGRLLDLSQQRHLSLANIEILVLDEADRMLDMGFIPDVRRILALVPRQRQTLFFSATMPDEVVALSRSMLHEPIRVEVAPPAATADRIDQTVYLVPKSDKRRLLAHLLHSEAAMKRVLVFTRTKHGANKVVKDLERSRVDAEAIHGNKAQRARERALANFKAGTTRVLVATDIAARGIDVEGITHVVNYDLPNIPESYVHRIGRTARAGAAGIAYSFCDGDEQPFLRDIERLIRSRIPRATLPSGMPEVPVSEVVARPSTPPQARSGGAPQARGGGSSMRSAGGSPRQPHPRDRVSAVLARYGIRR